MADYADALAMSQGRNFAGKPIELVQLALTIDPTQWKALAMSGSEAFERKDYKAAVDYLATSADTAPAGFANSSALQASIDEARRWRECRSVAQAQKGGAASGGSEGP